MRRFCLRVKCLWHRSQRNGFFMVFGSCGSSFSVFTGNRSSSAVVTSSGSSSDCISCFIGSQTQLSSGISFVSVGSVFIESVEITVLLLGLISPTVVWWFALSTGSVLIISFMANAL